MHWCQCRFLRDLLDERINFAVGFNDQCSSVFMWFLNNCALKVFLQEMSFAKRAGPHDPNLLLHKRVPRFVTRLQRSAVNRGDDYAECGQSAPLFAESGLSPVCWSPSAQLELKFLNYLVISLGYSRLTCFFAVEHLIAVYRRI